MDYYPINVNLVGKQVVVIGGGKIAERKIVGMLSTGADITVISPDLTDYLLQLFSDGKISWKKKTFSPADIEHAFLIMAAANLKEVNQEVLAAALPHQLISSVDDPESSNFILPSVLRQGKLIITVSTSGASPILAKNIKKQISSQYGDEYKEYVEFLFSARQKILHEIQDAHKKKELLSAIASPDFLYCENREEKLAFIMNRY